MHIGGAPDRRPAVTPTTRPDWLRILGVSPPLCKHKAHR